jgi:hypothetical protein
MIGGVEYAKDDVVFKAVAVIWQNERLNGHAYRQTGGQAPSSKETTWSTVREELAV